MAAQNELLEFYKQVPPVTRALTTGSTGVSLLCALGILSPYKVLNVWPLVWSRGQYWRPITSFLYAGTGINLVFTLFMLYSQSINMETTVFPGSTSDYVMYLLTQAVAILGMSTLVGGHAHLNTLLMSIMYTWSQQSPESVVQFMYGLRIKAKFLAPAMLGLTLLTSGLDSALQQATGIAAAYAYEYVRRTRPRWLEPPAWLSGLVSRTGQGGRRLGGGRGPESRGYGTAFRRAPPSSSSGTSWSNTGRSTSAFGSRGHRLGSS